MSSLLMMITLWDVLNAKRMLLALIMAKAKTNVMVFQTHAFNVLRKQTVQPFRENLNVLH